MKNIDNIKVRMYRHGFGDCFLIRYYDGKEEIYKMLIDCGLKHNDKVVDVSIEDVVKDIENQVLKEGKPQIDALVVTHEHWDHVSAFKPEKKLFDKFKFGQVWMSWTENPKDPIAQQINKYLKEGVTALGIASEKLKFSLQQKEEKGEFEMAYKGKELFGMREGYNKSLEQVLEFYGPFSATETTPSGVKIKDNYDISIETQKSFDHIKSKLASGSSCIKYFEPGSLFEDAGILPGVRIYILGPPKNKKINKDAPSSGVNKEVYFGVNNDSYKGFVRGILNSVNVYNLNEDGNPFSREDVINEERGLFKSYFETKNSWRKIDDDWLDIAGGLALQMDGDTNNTSLVLAIEIIKTGKVLLFPGDAQVGNWLSWHDYDWEVKIGTETKKVNAKDLLKNTVFYKAGHHGSHNATLKELGLELMEHDELVVFVPEKNDQYSGIPFVDLLERMKEKAKGRVVFSADQNYLPEELMLKKPEALSTASWKKFKSNIRIEKKFIEYTVK